MLISVSSVRRRLAASALLIVVAFALGWTPLPDAETGSVAEAAASPGPAGPSPSEHPDQPVVWFGPLPPLPSGSMLPFTDGSVDYLDLWEPDAPWLQAARRVRIFSMPATFVEHYATDEDLRTVIAGAAREGMALALEVGPLPGSESCGAGVEGFGGVYTLDQVRRIHQLGGRVDIIAFDEPFAFGRFWDGPNACRWSTDRVAREAARYVGLLRQVEPGVVVGDIEPLWTDISVRDLADWLEAYRLAAGEPLAFLHLDPDWERRDWPEALVATESMAGAMGIPVGVYYNGGDARSDEAWADLAMERAYTHEEVNGGRPDEVIFGSWWEHPDQLLPETEASTFTGLIARYLGARTRIRLDRVRPSHGKLVARGRLATTSGEPVTGPVTLEATPLDGQVQVLRSSGIVPTGATSALIVFRANTEGAGPGQVVIRIYRVAYVEDGRPGNSVRDPRFSRGLEAWAPYGAGRATVIPSDRGRGRMLRLEARSKQPLSVDATDRIAVTPGASYHLSVEAAIPVSSAGTAYVAVIFFDRSESARRTLPLDPEVVELGSVITDPSGMFEFAKTGLERGRYRVTIAYAGDAGHWPSRSRTELTRV